MPESMQRIRSMQVGMPAAVPADAGGRAWTTGIFKHPVQGTVWLGALNLHGDAQADLKAHGGPDKAVCVYPAEHYPYWAAVLGRSELPYGAFGENFTTEGLLESDACVGDQFRVGSAIVEITQPRRPCWKLARRWGVRELALLVQQSGRTGWYFRVLHEGEVQPGDALHLLARPYPQWRIAVANTVMNDDQADAALVEALAGCPALSENWRGKLLRRLAGEVPASAAARLYGEAD